jgi:uncharacterized protein YjbJ (UPF0337 family)
LQAWPFGSNVRHRTDEPEQEVHPARQVTAMAATSRVASAADPGSSTSKEIFMNKDQVKGAVKHAAGKVQQKTGEAIGSTDQQVKGLAKQVAGTVQKAYGDVKAVLKHPKKT